MKNIESIRNQNIQRNKDLLKKLNLQNPNILENIDSTSKTKTKTTSNKSRKVQKDSTPSIPTRRSRRLAYTEEDEDEKRRREEEENKESERQQTIRDARLAKLSGDFEWNVLRADAKLGLLLNEDLIYGRQKKPNIKIDGIQSELPKSFPRFDGNNSEESSHKLVSSGLKQICDEFDRKALFAEKGKDFIKLTPNRVTSLNFHPNVNDRIISAGDTSGCLGIWAVDSGHDEAQTNTIILKPHGRTISRIAGIPNCVTRFVTASYDGSCRNFDFNKQIVTECISIEDSEGFSLGISDMSMVSENVLYLTTLEGHFLLHDIRLPIKKPRYRDMMRLHDKKVGGFAANPNASHEIATASLDRTLKIWDLRKHNPASISSIDDGLSSPIIKNNYTSRLSISNADWNANNLLICNGYDDSIRIFDIKSSKNTSRDRTSPAELWPHKEIRHNCQSGRWVSILKARWQENPRDGFQKFAIGNMSRSIDIFSETGRKISSLSADTMSGVPAVLTFHPSMNWIVGGSSSGKIYLFV